MALRIVTTPLPGDVAGVRAQGRQSDILALGHEQLTLMGAAIETLIGED